MSEVQLFPQMTRSRWDKDELVEALHSASPHVRFLLKELSENDRVAARELKSKRVAYAIVQRICNSSNKDNLVLTHVDDDSGEKTYSLNPEYRDLIKPVVGDAEEPPPTPPRVRRKTLGMGRGRKNMSATDGIADPRGLGRIRQVTQSANGRSIAFPEGVPLDFCQELMAFLNSTAGSPGRYRIVLDSSGPRLEIG
jgi:hypothetical protein